MAEGSPADHSLVALVEVEDSVIPGRRLLRVRFCQPEQNGVRPAILFVHGGGFIPRPGQRRPPWRRVTVRRHYSPTAVWRFRRKRFGESHEDVVYDIRTTPTVRLRHAA
jgi:hypothetical protein